MVNETGSRNRILEMCKFRIWIRSGITSTILHRFSPNFARGSEIWSHRRLLFVTQTGSSLPILEMCGFRFWQFLGSGDQIFQRMSTKSHRKNSTMPTLYSMVNETGNRNRILEMCKFRIWLQLIITPTVLYRFSPNFACSSQMWSRPHLLFERQTGSSLPILEVCGFPFCSFQALVTTFFNRSAPSRRYG